MNQSTLKILFFLGSRPLKNGEHQVFVRVTINGQYEQVSIKRSVDKRMWNQSKGCSKARDRGSVELNDYIEELKASINSTHKSLLLTEGYISPKALLGNLFNPDEKKTVLAIMGKEITRMESLIGIDYEYVTINRYKNCMRCVAVAIRKHYNKEDVKINNIIK